MTHYSFQGIIKIIPHQKIITPHLHFKLIIILALPNEVWSNPLQLLITETPSLFFIIFIFVWRPLKKIYKAPTSAGYKINPDEYLITGVRRFSEGMGLEVLHDNIREQRGPGPAAGAAEGARTIRLPHRSEAARRRIRLSVSYLTDKYEFSTTTNSGTLPEFMGETSDVPASIYGMHTL